MISQHHMDVHRPASCWSAGNVDRQPLRHQAPFATKAELRAEFAERLAPLATKAELELLTAKAKAKAELKLWGSALIESSERRLLTELARHVNAICEAMSTQISAIDERYADLPPRVSQLETEVFAPRRR